MLKRKGHRSKHFKNAQFLKALGQHCQKLRSQKGYSIDRLSKESDRLSASVIHRLENGIGAVTVSALFRYAQGLAVHPQELFAFTLPHFQKGEERSPLKILKPDDPRIKKEAFHSLLPLYSLQSASAIFGQNQSMNPEGWIEVKKPQEFCQKTFVVRAPGDSMAPVIQNGDYLVFQTVQGEHRQGKIVLAQYRGSNDPDTGGNYTIKKYYSSKIGAAEGTRNERQITLLPANPDFEPMILYPRSDQDFKVIAEYLFTL